MRIGLVTPNLSPYPTTDRARNCYITNASVLPVYGFNPPGYLSPVLWSWKRGIWANG